LLTFMTSRVGLDALFPPATIAERVKVFDLLRERLGIGLEPGVDAAALLGESHEALSAADLEAILVRGSRRMASGGQKILSAALLRELIRDFQPRSYPLELEYQRLIAAFECTSRRLLPPDLAGVPRSDRRPARGTAGGTRNVGVTASP